MNIGELQDAVDVFGDPRPSSFNYLMMGIVNDMNDVILGGLETWYNWTYIIYGDNETDIIISHDPRTVLTKSGDDYLVPNGLKNNNNNDYCAALKAAVRVANGGTNDAKILASLNFGPVQSSSTCLDDNGQQITFNTHFTAAISLSTDAVTRVKMNDIEAIYGNFDGCAYLEDMGPFLGIGFTLPQLYSYLWVESGDLVYVFINIFTVYFFL